MIPPEVPWFFRWLRRHKALNPSADWGAFEAKGDDAYDGWAREFAYRYVDELEADRASRIVARGPQYSPGEQLGRVLAIVEMERFESGPMATTEDEEDRDQADEWVIMLRPRHDQLPGWPSAPAAERVLFELERIARMSAYAHPSNRRLSDATGLSTQTVRIALKTLEQLGWIQSVLAGPGDQQRRCLLMLRRIAIDTPAVDTPEAVAQAIEELNHREGGTDHGIQ